LHQPVEDSALTTSHLESLARQAVADDDIEVTAEYQVGSRACERDPIENLVHGSDVAAFAGRSVNAEDAERASIRPRRMVHLAADDPTIIAGDWNG
jgi:hypothetical protein